jgi:hypothetical protein
MTTGQITQAVDPVVVTYVPTAQTTQFDAPRQAHARRGIGHIAGRATADAVLGCPRLPPRQRHRTTGLQPTCGRQQIKEVNPPPLAVGRANGACGMALPQANHRLEVEGFCPCLSTPAAWVRARLVTRPAFTMSSHNRLTTSQNGQYGPAPPTYQLTAGTPFPLGGGSCNAGPQATTREH